MKQYQIQDLLNQSTNHVVYEIVSDSGELFHLIRLIYNGVALGERLTGSLNQAQIDLKNLPQSALPPIIDSGVDPADSYPWIIIPPRTGQTLAAKTRERKLSPEEFELLKSEGQKLITELGPLSCALSFSPEFIVDVTHNGQKTPRFQLDYHTWFQSYLTEPLQTNAPEKFRQLIDSTRRFVDFPPTKLTSAASANHTNGPSPPIPPAPPKYKQKKSPLIPILATITALVIGLVSYLIFNQKNSPSPSLKEETKTVTAAESTQERPEILTAFPKADPASVETRKQHIGQWVSVTAPIKEKPQKDTLTVTDSPLIIKLSSEHQAPNYESLETTAYGFLETENLLTEAVTKIHYPADYIFTIDDELQIREYYKNKNITFKGTVKNLKPSGSKKTYYLHFKTKKPEFTFSSLVRDKPEDFINSLRSFEGKAIQLNGKVTVEKNGRLVINFKSIDQIKTVEN